MTTTIDGRYILGPEDASFLEELAAALDGIAIPTNDNDHGSDAAAAV